MDRVFTEYSQLFFSKVVSSLKKVQAGNDSCILDLSFCKCLEKLVKFFW